MVQYTHLNTQNDNSHMKNQTIRNYVAINQHIMQIRTAHNTLEVYRCWHNFLPTDFNSSYARVGLTKSLPLLTTILRLVVDKLHKKSGIFQPFKQIYTYFTRL